MSVIAFCLGMAKAYFCGIHFVYNEKLRQLLSSLQLPFVAHIFVKFSTLSYRYQQKIVFAYAAIQKKDPQRIYITFSRATKRSIQQI